MDILSKNVQKFSLNIIFHIVYRCKNTNLDKVVFLADAIEHILLKAGIVTDGTKEIQKEHHLHGHQRPQLLKITPRSGSWLRTVRHSHFSHHRRHFRRRRRRRCRRLSCHRDCTWPGKFCKKATVSRGYLRVVNKDGSWYEPWWHGKLIVVMMRTLSFLMSPEIVIMASASATRGELTVNSITA